MALVRRLLWISISSAIGVLIVYVIGVRTGVGQRFDDIAFAGRAVENPEATRVANELLHAVTRSTLIILTAALVLLALARRQARLAFVVGATVIACVVTTEILKTQVFSRPQLDDLPGIEINSYPSGHATISMALSLGLVMVAPIRRRLLALVPACGFAMLFGVGVMATGWHRPSDVIGAYLVCAAWFAATTAVLLWRGTAAPVRDSTETSPDPHIGLTAAAVGAASLAVAVGVLIWTLEDGSVRLVDGGWAYLVMSAVILLLAVSEIVGYNRLLSGVTLDLVRAEDDSVPTSH